MQRAFKATKTRKLENVSVKYLIRINHLSPYLFDWHNQASIEESESVYLLSLLPPQFLQKHSDLF